MKTHSIIGRIFWMIYACPIALILLPDDALEIRQYGLAIIPYVALDFLLTLPSIVAMFLHMWDARLLVSVFWKVYAFVLIAWDLLFNLFLHPAVTGDKLGQYDLIGAIVLLPLYIAVFRYAFRNWEKVEG
jgi:hypothetical protein